MLQYRNKNIHARRGAAIVGIVVLLVVVNLIVFGLVIGGMRESELVANRIDTVRAFYASEAGVSLAVREIVTNTDEDGDGGIGTISNDSDESNNPAIGQSTLVVTSTEVDGTTIYKSAATSGTAVRTIAITVE